MGVGVGVLSAATQWEDVVKRCGPWGWPPERGAQDGRIAELTHPLVALEYDQPLDLVSGDVTSCGAATGIAPAGLGERLLVVPPPPLRVMHERPLGLAV